MYKNYIFDLYGTLIDINTNEWNRDLWDKMAVFYGYSGALYTGEELNRAYTRLVGEEKEKAHKRHKGYSVIDIKLDRVFKKLYEEKGVKATKAQAYNTAAVFRCYSTSYIRLYPGVIDLLDTLKARGRGIYLLSNAQRCFTLNEIKMLGLDKYFDGILISSDEECSKPDVNYFKILFDRYSLSKEDSVMIGNDYISDISGAKSFGIDSLYIHQSISPEIKGELLSDYSVMDGDVYKIKKLLLS